MKKIIVVLSIFLLPICSYAQVNINIVGNNLNIKYDSLDQASLRCMYKHYYCVDTTSTVSESSKIKDDFMILQIGQKGSHFYSYNSYKLDSLLKHLSPEEINTGQYPKIRGASYNIFKGYPSENLIFTDKFMSDYHKYEEPIPSFNWKIEDETKNILGYPAQKAICDFRGRQYIAWFTPEIPVSEGPWKFNGLPGLILEVSDTENHYRFEIVGVQKVDNETISIADLKYIETDLKKYYRTLRRMNEDPMGYLKLMHPNIKVTIKSVDGSANSKMEKHNALKYDFIEKL